MTVTYSIQLVETEVTKKKKEKKDEKLAHRSMHTSKVREDLEK